MKQLNDKTPQRVMLAVGRKHRDENVTAIIPKSVKLVGDGVAEPPAPKQPNVHAFLIAEALRLKDENKPPVLRRATHSEYWSREHPEWAMTRVRDLVRFIQDHQHDGHRVRIAMWRLREIVRASGGA